MINYTTPSQRNSTSFPGTAAERVNLPSPGLCGFKVVVHDLIKKRMKKKRGTKGGLVTDEDYGGLGRSTDGIPRQ